MTTDSHDFLKEEEDNIDRFNETINDIFTNPVQKEFDRIVSEMTEHREKYQMQTSYYRNMKKNLKKVFLTLIVVRDMTCLLLIMLNVLRYHNIILTNLVKPTLFHQ